MPWICSYMVPAFYAFHARLLLSGKSLPDHDVMGFYLSLFPPMNVSWENFILLLQLYR